MVCGSGMNGRSREARSGGQPAKKHSPSHSQKQVHKPTASAEALQMARILEDSKQMSEINSKVQKVLSVVPGCSEEQVHLVLHDNGYDLDKTISALLDSDGQTNEGEWTTTSSRKTRKKATTESEESSHKVGFGRSSRTASNSTRENYGGSVSVHNTRENYGGGVSAHSNTGAGRNRTQGGRSKGQSTNRRTRVSGAPGEQRRGRTREKERSHGMAPSMVQATTVPVVDEEWDIVDEIPQAADSTTITSGAGSITEAWTTSDVWSTPVTDHSDSKYWEPAQQQMDSAPQEIDTQPHSVFPEAIPGQAGGQERLLGQYSMSGEEPQIQLHSTPSEITPSLASTGGGDRDTAIRHVSLDSREKVSRKPKRLARSQIPTKPVEMPGGIDSLDVQFGELGIDFIGLESSSPPPPSNEDTTVTGMLSYSDLQPRFGESSVSVSTSSTSTALGSETGANVLPVENSTCMPPSGEAQLERELSSSGGLRSPPGLPHPSTSTSEQPTVQHQQPQAQLDSTSALASDVSASQQTTADAQLRLDDVPSSSGVLKSMSIDLPMELPSNTPQTAPMEVISQQPSYTSVSSTGSVYSTSSNVTAAASVSNLSSTSSSRSTTASHISTQHNQQHVTQQGKPSTSSVPPGMLYPHMLPAQYPFIPAPAMYNYDPTDMSRYSSGSMAYFPTSTDPSMGGAMPSRDHTSSSYQAVSDHTKFPRGGADIGTAVAVSSTQQSQQGTSLQQQQQQQPGGAGQQPSSGQQMGPAFMGGPFYGSMFYPTMYGPMPAFSQAANFGMTYEDVVAAQTPHDYSKLYAAGAGSSLSKPSSLPVSSSGGLDSATLAGSAGSSSFKHLDSGKSFNYNVPAGVGGSQAAGYYMQMPHFPHMMVGPGAGDVGAMSTPHSRMTQQKHSNKVGGYQGAGGSSSYWSSPAANHSS